MEMYHAVKPCVILIQLIFFRPSSVNFVLLQFRTSGLTSFAERALQTEGPNRFYFHQNTRHFGSFYWIDKYESHWHF